MSALALFILILLILAIVLTALCGLRYPASASPRHLGWIGVSVALIALLLHWKM